MIDYVKLYADDLARHCQDGEHVLAATPVTYHPGDEQVGPQDKSISFDLNGLDVPAWNDAATRAIGGRTLISPPDGAAVGLARATSGHVHLLLTTRRLAVLDKLGHTEGSRVLWESDRSRVATVAHDPHWLFQWGRVMVGFADGSVVRLMAGLVSAGHAKRLERAFSQPHPADPAGA